MASEHPAGRLPPLWTCPHCGKSYVTRNMWHSCVALPIAVHFEGRSVARALFEELVAALEREGPVTVSVSKTRIELMTRARFAGVQVRRDWLRLGFWLKREISSPRFLRVDHYGRDHVYQLALRSRDQLDAELLGWLREARAVGDQRWVAPDRATPRATSTADDSPRSRLPRAEGPIRPAKEDARDQFRPPA